MCEGELKQLGYSIWRDLYLKLVLPGFSGGRGVEEIDCENLRLC